MINNKYKVLAVLLVCSVVVDAQPSFDGTVDDVGSAPIPGLLLAMVVAIGIGVAKLRNKKG